MTTLLEQAFAKAAKLPADEQDVLASRLLAELEDEDDFDRAISARSDKLAILARQALVNHNAGLTEELDPDCPRILVRRVSSANCWLAFRGTLNSRHGMRTSYFETTRGIRALTSSGYIRILGSFRPGSVSVFEL